MDWLDLLAVRGTLKSLLQHHSSKASILLLSAFFMVQLSYIYMTTGRTITLTRQTFVGKVISLLFNMLSRLVIAFLPRSKCLLISWLQSPSAVILKTPKVVSHCFHCFPIYFPWSDGTRCHNTRWPQIKDVHTDHKWSYIIGENSSNIIINESKTSFSSLEKEMATHSRILVWRIPWTEEPGGLQSMGLQESDMT